MQASSLFVLGLVLGALAVFGVRAVAFSEAESDASHADHVSPEPHVSHADHASHEDHAATGPADASDAPAGHERAPVADDDRPPENEICPVMGNPVDPKVYVDYQGRRIGFCCPGCDATFLQDPEKYLKKVDEELAAREEDK